ncbi:hypothetical protein ACT16_10955 [Mycobacterium heckeshornense]|nr:hypothetical protein ACT16_10955 [Mycobacterium heckeshornense]
MAHSSDFTSANTGIGHIELVYIRFLRGGFRRRVAFIAPGGYFAAAPEAVGIGNGSRCPTVRRAVSPIRHVRI